MPESVYLSPPTEYRKMSPFNFPTVPRQTFAAVYTHQKNQRLAHCAMMDLTWSRFYDTEGDRYLPRL